MKLIEEASYMEKIINSLEKVLSYVYMPLLKINIVLLVVWPLIIVIYVILRFFGIALLFIEEYTQYWLVFVSYTAIAYAFREGAHINVNIFTQNIKGISKNILDAITDLIILYVSLYLFQRVTEWCIYGFTTKVTSAFPSNSLLWPFYTIPMIGFALLIMETLIKFYKDLKNITLKKNTL